ncbi:MAG: tetratricopeptide repeat protein [bacterium]|nr:tetratricopeptide repeat protein [bacterium]
MKVIKIVGSIGWIVCLCLLLCSVVFAEEKSAIEYFNEGLKLMEDGDVVLAEGKFQQAVKLDKTNIYYRYALGIALGANGKHKEAVEELKGVVKKLPDLQQAWYYLRIFWVKLVDDLTNAKNFFSEMAKRYSTVPIHACIQLNCAYIFLEEKNYSIAEEYIQRAIKLRSNYSEAYAFLGKLEYERKGDIDKAIEYYKKAIKFDPDYAEAYFNLGVLLREKQAYEEAKKNLEIAKKLKPSLVEKVEFIFAMDNKDKRGLVLRGEARSGIVETVTLLVIYFPGGVGKLVGGIEDSRVKAQKEFEKAIKEKLPKESKIEVVFGKEYRIFDFRTTPNFYILAQLQEGKEDLVFSDKKVSGIAKKVNLRIRKVPDINLRFDPEGVMIEDTLVGVGYSCELTRNRKIEIIDILPEEKKVVMLVRSK